MQKKIGFLFGTFCLLVAIVNFSNNPVICRLNVMGMLLIGIAFMESIYFGDIGKVLQVVTMIGVSTIMVFSNTQNSLVPVITIIFAVLLSDKYLPKKKNLSKYYTMMPLMAGLLSSWSTAAIVNNVLLYGALTGAMIIIQNDKI